MSPVQRPLSGDVLVFDLNEEHERTADPALLSRSGRNARTLLKVGGMRATLIVLAPGAELLSAAPAVRHRVTSEEGGTFLLTLIQ